MSKISQVVAQPFGSLASAGQIGVFGSKAAGSPQTTADAEIAQSLSQWLAGWNAAVIDGNSPCIQDMNAFCFVVMYILTYIQQEGVQEWNTGIVYFKGSIVNSGGNLYVSLTDNNEGNAVTDATHWAQQGKVIRSVTGTDTATAADNLILANPTSGSFVENLPAASVCPSGFSITVKNIATNGNTVTVTPNGADTIDGQATIVLNCGTTYMDSITMVAVSGTGWYII